MDSSYREAVAWIWGPCGLQRSSFCQTVPEIVYLSCAEMEKSICASDLVPLTSTFKESLSYTRFRHIKYTEDRNNVLNMSWKQENQGAIPGRDCIFPSPLISFYKISAGIKSWNPILGVKSGTELLKKSCFCEVVVSWPLLLFVCLVS